MPLTNFPQGLTSFGFPLIGSSPVLGLGFVYFVNSATGSNASGYGTDPGRPFASIAYALTKCTADHDDTIFVASGHAEAISGAAGWTTVSGVRIIGLARGAKRPTVTFGTSTAAQIVCSGNNVQMENLVFDLTGIDAVVVAFAVTGTDLTVRNCRIVISGATNQATRVFTLSGASRATFDSCDFFGTSDAGPASAIEAVAATVGLQVLNCNIRGNFSAGPIVATSTFHLTDMLIERNHITNFNGTSKVCFALTTSSTGVMKNNTCLGTTWTTAADVVSGGTNVALRWFQNFGFDDGAGAVSAVLVPAAGTIA